MLRALEDISSTKKRLKIEIPAEAIEAEIKKALLDLQRRANIPGFRPGKTPMAMIEKKYGKDVEADVLEKVIPEFYRKAIKDADVMPVAGPVIEESDEFKRNTPVSITLFVEVMPKVENISYEGIFVKDMPVEVKEEEIEDALRHLAEEKATYESVDDAIGEGDLITIDYKVAEDGSDAEDVVLKVGSGPYPKEFFDGLIGKNKDEELKIDASFPAEAGTQFDGKRLTFDVRIKDIKRRNIPAIDDEFAKDLSYDNVDLLRDKIKERLVNLKNREADIKKQSEILDNLLNTHDFELPESLVNGEVGRMIGEVRAYGKDLRPDEALKEEFLPWAKKNVKSSILLELISAKEGVKVTDDEVRGEIVNIAMRSYMSPENIMKYYIDRDGSLEGLKINILQRKTLELLLSKAKVEKGE